MDTNTPSVDRILQTLAQELATEMERGVQEAQRRQQEEFSRQLEAAVRQTQAAADEATEALRRQMDERLREAQATWAEERARLDEELHRWRTFAEAQQNLAESVSQTDMLRRFLKLAAPFAGSLAVYVMKADGLALWNRCGDGAFPPVISQNTIDPELFFRPVAVREKTVAAICAHPPVRPDALDFLTRSLERSIELFGARLQAAGRSGTAARSAATSN